MYTRIIKCLCKKNNKKQQQQQQTFTADWWKGLSIVQLTNKYVIQAAKGFKLILAGLHAIGVR
jgi:hypothetical protein